MHNIKEIRKDFDAFSKALKKRSIDIDLNKLKKLDIDNRDLIQKKETLEKEKKDISKTKDKALFSSTRVRTSLKLIKTERVGFEPTNSYLLNDFESFAFNHSATSP